MKIRQTLIAASVVVMACACGARVSPEQVRLTQGSAKGPGTAVGAAADAGPQAAGPSATVPAAGGDAPSTTVAGASTGGGTAAPGAAPVAASSGATSTGDNGGATDVGLTGSQLRIGTVATLSGPVPGLFAGAVYGTQAWAAYQNSLGGINGRKISVDVRDDQFDTGQNRAQTVDAIGKDFGLVGSFSLYDDAGLREVEKAGVADIQVPLTSGLQVSPANFSINPVRRGTPLGPWQLFKDKFPGAIGAVGGIYGDIPSAKDSYMNNKAAMESLGYKFVYERGYQATETDFTADVVRMKGAGVKFFFTNGDVKTAARLAKAMAAQSFKPAAFVVFGPAYDAQFVPLAGTSAEGVFNVGTQAMYLGEDAAFNPEVRLFLQWLNRVKPGYKPDLFAAYGWGSGRFFAKAAQDAGPKLTRPSLLAALKKIDDWNGYGMFPPAGPASKRPATCFIIETVHGGKFERWNSPPPGFNCGQPFYFRK
jgi:ABC-type branched-subunit amino acid transport system substrate-binding protein